MKGILFVNLGSPDSTDIKDIKTYLDEFLMDPYVIDYPYWLRSLIVRGIILKTRPNKSAKAYRKIWWDEGSPLKVISERFINAVSKKLPVPIEIAMRYANPSIERGLNSLAQKGVTEILAIPLYPQYATSTTKTVNEKIRKIREEQHSNITINYFPPFYYKEDYLNVLAKSVEEKIQDLEYDHILFSYHGIPENHIKKEDPTKSHCKIDKSCCKNHSEAHKVCYKYQCLETTKGVAKRLQLDESKYSNSFQSRLAARLSGGQWLKPYTDQQLMTFPKKGIKKLVVLTPAFIADCLETLEEIAIEGEEQFLDAGGEKYTVIPCLNDRGDWVASCTTWCKDWIDN